MRKFKNESENTQGIKYVNEFDTDIYDNSHCKAYEDKFSTNEMDFSQVNNSNVNLSHQKNYNQPKNINKERLLKINGFGLALLILLILIKSSKITDAESVDIVLQKTQILHNDYKKYLEESKLLNEDGQIYNMDITFTEFEIYFKKNLNKISDDIFIEEILLDDNEAFFVFNKPTIVNVKFNKSTDKLKSIVIQSNYDNEDDHINTVVNEVIKTFDLKSSYKVEIDENDISHFESEVINSNKYIYYNYIESEVIVIEITPFEKSN